jgi:hypothetical protein
VSGDDVGADSADQIIPTSSGFEQRGGCDIRFFLGSLAHARIGSSCAQELALIILRKSIRQRAPPPGWRCFVDRGVFVLSDCHRGIAIGGMQPAAAKIKRRSRGSRDSPGATAETGTCFDDQAFDPGAIKAASGRNASCAAANDDGFDVAICHA